MATKKKLTLLRSRDVAFILDMGPDEVIELAREGKLKGTKKGRFWWFGVADVRAYQRKMKRRTGKQEGGREARDLTLEEGEMLKKRIELKYERFLKRKLRERRAKRQG